MISYGVISFGWDDKKAESNLAKHGITFGEASTVFYDPHALVIDDESSLDEKRFIIVGISATERVMTTCRFSNGPDEVIYIADARKAAEKEESEYWRRWHEG